MTKPLSRREIANAVRVLAMDAVEQANSGHPGMPLGMADIAEVLWRSFLVHHPENPAWPNRDRFVLSNGHGSMLLYALLHLTGYDLSLEDLKQFRQLHSKTPGHPEHGETPGVETTTGPLGQGLANAVGMAIAERALAAEFNQPGHDIIDHYTYVFLGDGCLMEGISHEVSSLAGTLGLGKLIAVWDDNGISIDGEVKTWFSDNTAERFRSYGWHVIESIDGHNPSDIEDAFTAARAVHDKPTLLCCKTVIGFGSPNRAGHHDVHGSALGATEAAATRDALNWPHALFTIPSNYYEAWDARAKGREAESAWQKKFDAYQTAYPELARSLLRRLEKKLPDAWQTLVHETLQKAVQQNATVATRKASQQTLQAFAPALPELLGGSADLTPSNLTHWGTGCVAISHEVSKGNYLHYGVREFGMSAIMNGIALYGGFIPFGGTFLTFVDYARNAIRMAALMKQRVIFVYTHDSIGLGEDGPTHQPVEHLAMLRLTPNVSVWRPCDAAETVVAWQKAIERLTGPTALIFSRQNLPAQAHTSETLNNIEKGGYVLHEPTQSPEAILIATGSEVFLAMEAAQTLLSAHQKHIRVVSMPSTDAFDAQPQQYRDQVLPPKLTQRIAIEASARDFWYKYVGLNGNIVGMDSYGMSAPAPAVYKALDITVEKIVEKTLALIQR